MLLLRHNKPTVWSSALARDDNQQSRRARRTAASPWRSRSRCTSTRTLPAPRCRSARRSTAVAGVRSACSGRTAVPRASGAFGNALARRDRSWGPPGSHDVVLRRRRRGRLLSRGTSSVLATGGSSTALLLCRGCLPPNRPRRTTLGTKACDGPAKRRESSPAAVSQAEFHGEL
jgi:hypothetical protein